MKKLLVILSLIWCLDLAAQKEKYQITTDDYQNSGVEMADGMRQSGKIYVVVGVVFAIFAGIVFYLVRLDKKVSLLEKEVAENTKTQS